jgi:hypothetical protein
MREQLVRGVGDPVGHPGQVRVRVRVRVRDDGAHRKLVRDAAARSLRSDPLGGLGFALPKVHCSPAFDVRRTFVRGYLLFASVQMNAVEYAAGFEDFKDEVGEFWEPVSRHLKLTVRRWSEKTEVEQWQLLAAFGLKDRDQQMVLAREINKLLGISEWHGQGRGDATPTPGHSLARLSVPWHPSTWVICLAGKGWGHLLRPRECAVCVTTSAYLAY